MNDLLQEITIYHKDNEWIRYNIEASVRNTSYLNRNNTGVNTTDNALIRVFDTDGYNNTWKCEKGDIIVLKSVSDDIIKAPLTEMREKYGKSIVIEVSSVEPFIFNDIDLKEINHVKIGGR